MQYKLRTFSKSSSKMKLIIFLLNALAAKNFPIHSDLPEQLIFYQNSTGISDVKLYEIYEQSLIGLFPVFREIIFIVI